jgi:NAD(P)-dependent dehydrogenase (short-subunit alcohol dehydrogenase family)
VPIAQCVENQSRKPSCDGIACGREDDPRDRSTDGIGRETARVLGERGARVLVHGRSRAKAERAALALREETGRDAFEPVIGDFARLDDVRALAADVAARWPRLDVLVNNAGIYATERGVSAEGFELTLAVNHLAPFALTHLLIDTLGRGARVVFVSSNVHRSAGGAELISRLINSAATGEFDGYAAYADSKLANVLTAFELARRLEPRGVAVNVMHPGVIGTKLLTRRPSQPPPGYCATLMPQRLSSWRSAHATPSSSTPWVENGTGIGTISMIDVSMKRNSGEWNTTAVPATLLCISSRCRLNHSALPRRTFADGTRASRKSSTCACRPRRITRSMSTRYCWKSSNGISPRAVTITSG